MREWVDESVHAGATIAYASNGDVLGPTVLTDVPSGQLAWDEEIFGPVIAVRSVPDIDTAFRTVNETRYGLHASVFTSSLDTAFAAIDPNARSITHGAARRDVDLLIMAGPRIGHHSVRLRAQLPRQPCQQRRPSPSM